MRETHWSSLTAARRTAALVVAVLVVVVLAVGCGQAETAGSDTAAGAELPNFQPDGQSGGDGVDAATGADGGAGDADGGAVGQDTAGDAAADTTAGADVVTDAALADSSADAAADSAASDVASEVAADAVVEIAQETAQGDAGDAAGDATVDATVDATADATVDATVDAGPAVCSPGQLQRCWVECTQIYQAGCIHGDVPPRIPGVRDCVGGQWAACVTAQSCKELVGTCDNGAKKPLTVTCLDGSKKQGVHHCLKPLGANCASSYWGGAGALDCPDLCTTAADQCPTAGAVEPCEALCDVPDGPKVPGTRTCQAVCDAQVWSTCLTGDGCWKAAGSPGQ